MCLNFESRIERVPVLVLQFDCIQMGVNGVNLLKPEEAEEVNPAPEDIDQGSNIYNEVNEVKKNSSFINEVKMNTSFATNEVKNSN